MSGPNQIAMGRLVACLSAVAVAALVAACGGGSPAPVSHTVTEVVTQTASSTTAQPSTGTAAQSTSTQAPTTSTASAQATPACVAADLAPSYLGSNGALGQIALSFALKNTGSGACHTYGFPGVEFLSSSGAALPTNSTRTTHDVLGSTPATEIVLAPGQQATFRMMTSDSGRGGGNAGCATASALQIIAPDDTATMRVAITNGTVECGTTSVSALQAGTGAVPGV